MCGWDMVHDGKFSLLVVGIMGTRLEKQTNFLCNFISFQVCTPVPSGSFLFRGFHPVLESANCVHF